MVHLSISRSTTHAAAKKSIFVVTLLLVFQLISGDAAAFKWQTHSYIASQAFRLFSNQELIDYAGEIGNGAVSADDYVYECEGDVCWWQFESVLAPRDHFWDADHDLPLCYPGANDCWGTAYARANYYWEFAIQEYAAGNKADAYKFLGYVVHHLSDMASPAHVHLDPHALPGDHDIIEDYLEAHYTEWQADRDASIFKFDSLLHQQFPESA